jgi:hypothetical protein
MERMKAIGSRLGAGLEGRDQVIGDKHNATNSLDGRTSVKSGRINVFSMKPSVISVALCNNKSIITTSMKVMIVVTIAQQKQ